MNILLIKPSTASVYGDLPASVQISLGLAYVASSIESMNHNVRVLDYDLDQNNYSFEQITMEQLSLFKPDAVGLTCTTPTFPNVVKICTFIKKYFPKVITIIGGPHPTVLPRESLKMECIDFAVIKEGELTIQELLTAIEGGRDFLNVKGIGFRKKSDIILTPQRELIKDLDSILFPAWHLFSTRYEYPDALSSHVFPIITSRGCPGKCSFCNSPNIFGQRFRMRSAENIIKEIELLKSKFGAKEIHIWDDNFTTIKKNVFSIQKKINEKNIKINIAFPNGIRSDCLSEDIIISLKKMGTYSIALGVESGSDDILKKANKHIDLTQVREIFRLLKKYKIESWAFFIIGLIGETKDTVKQTVQFAKETNPDVAKFHVFKPFPGTKAYDYLKERKLIFSDDFNDYGIHTPPIHNLPDLGFDEIVRLQKQAYIDFYFRPLKLLQQLFRIKSFFRFKINVRFAIAFFKKLLF